MTTNSIDPNVSFSNTELKKNKQLNKTLIENCDICSLLTSKSENRRSKSIHVFTIDNTNYYGQGIIN